MMIFNRLTAPAGVLLASVVALNFSMLTAAHAQPAQAPASDPTNAGKAVFSRANCVGCHKWHGNGGGGYGGDALSLRKTELTRDQIIEVVRCGRPGTGMPFHLRGAYVAEPCYHLKQEQLTGMMPPDAATFPAPGEVDAASDYVIAHGKGKCEPDYADCSAFSGERARVWYTCSSHTNPDPAP